MLRGRTVVPGVVEGEVLVSPETISGWGGIDPATGTIIEARHPLCGVSFAGRILVLPSGRGSSSSSSVLAEAIRKGTAPSGILLERPDPILAVGAIVAEFLYAIRMPVVVCDIAGVASGDRIAIGLDADGRAIVSIGRRPA